MLWFTVGGHEAVPRGRHELGSIIPIHFGSMTRGTEREGAWHGERERAMHGAVWKGSRACSVREGERVLGECGACPRCGPWGGLGYMTKNSGGGALSRSPPAPHCAMPALPVPHALAPHRPPPLSRSCSLSPVSASFDFVAVAASHAPWEIG